MALRAKRRARRDVDREESKGKQSGGRRDKKTIGEERNNRKET